MRILALVDVEAYPGEDPHCMEFHVTGALRRLGHDVAVVPFGPDVLKTVDALKTSGADLVFNMTERFEGDRRKDLNIAALLELLRLAYTGTRPAGLALCRNKATCKRILGYHRIRVPRFAQLEVGRARPPAKLGYPAIVKPLYEDGSDGIALASLVRSPSELEERARMIHERMKEPAICEEYIAGREIYVGVAGNGRLQTFPARELRFGKNEDGPHIATAKVKWDDEYRRKWEITYADAELPEPLARNVALLSKRIFRLLQLDGYARIDLRLTPENEIVFLEANPNPDLSHDADLATAAQRAGVPYDELIERIVNLGSRRQS